MNKKAFFVTAVIVIMTMTGICFAQDNPFFSGRTREEEPAFTGCHGVFSGLFEAINRLQRELNTSLSLLSRKINREKDAGLFFMLLAISFVYGIIHALGPGHGKVIMASYALSNEIRITQGILFGIFIAVIHTLSAVLLVSILYFFVAGTYSGYSREPGKIVSLISYGLISLMGLFLLIKTLIVDIAGVQKNGDDAAEFQELPRPGIKRFLIPAFIIGLIPCEGAVLILVFSLSINAYCMGVMLALTMSIGMAVTISVTGIIMICSKKGVLKLFSKKKRCGKIIGTIFGCAGSIVILLFGLMLFFSNI
ncbi:MAG: hypothetical protein JW881_00065 [Spirochaetales bacterium]|nr:hypothetical protein [Spirochaetales bacterium]